MTETNQGAPDRTRRRRWCLCGWLLFQDVLVAATISFESVAPLKTLGNQVPIGWYLRPNLTWSRWNCAECLRVRAYQRGREWGC